MKTDIERIRDTLYANKLKLRGNGQTPQRHKRQKLT